MGVSLPSRCCILYIFFNKYKYEYFKHAEHSPFFSTKCRLFHNATFFGSCIIHILYTGCVKFKCKTPLQKLMKLEFPRQIIETYSDVNFDLIATSERSRGTNGRTYRQAHRQKNEMKKLSVNFRNFCERALKLRATCLIRQ
jgi:hypothetical protein